MPFRLATPAFSQGGAIPVKYTCSGADVSPPLQWTAPPAGAKSLALVVDDPDAPSGTWIHWLLYNIPARAGGLREGLSTSPQLSRGMLQGRNSFGKIGYGGPCPPRGQVHRYFFRLYALDTMLPLKAGASRAELDSAMQGHLRGQAECMGRFGR